MEDNKKNVPKIIVLLVLLVLVYVFVKYGILYLAFRIFTYSGSSVKYETMANGIIVTDNYEIKDVKGYYLESDKLYVIEGYLTNKGKELLNYPTIMYSFYDENGILLGQSSSDISLLNSNETWKFKIVYSDIDAMNVSSYKLLDIYNDLY